MPVLTLDSGSQLLFPPGAAGAVTLINLSSTVTVYVATTPTVHSTDIPVGPGASVTFDGTQSWYGSALTTTAQVAVGTGVTGYFLPASLANIGGSKVYVQAGAPTGTIPVNSIWFNTTLSSLETWNGSAWVTEQFDASQLIQAATILGTQIAAQTIQASNVANGTLTTAQLAAAAGILGTQIASATITSANIAAHTIVAANIAANTITAAQLAAGIVYAGIVDATTVKAAQYIADGSSGEFLAYSGTPAAGNLVLSVNGAAANTTDASGNVVLPGTTVYTSSGGVSYAVNMFATNITIYTAASQAGPYTSHGGIVLQSAEGLTLHDLSGNGITLDTSGGPIVIGPSGAAAVSISSPLTTDQATIGAALTATSGTSASPTVITTDTWHNVTPPTGFTGLLRYRMRAENDVEVEAQLAVGTTAGTGVITLITLPAAYTPAQTQRDSCGVFCNGIPSSAGVQGILDLRWSADPAGTFTLRSFPGGAANTGITECSFNARYALD